MNKHKGFTLIELMIVVAILGILVAIILPYFQGSSKNSCSIYTPSNTYLGISKSSINSSGETELKFKDGKKSVTVNKFTADVVCNSN